MGNKNTTGNNETPNASQTKSDSSKSQLYKCEGFIKEVKIVSEGVSFTLEPAAPYIFEKKNDDGSTERCLLFVGDDKNPSAAKIIKAGHEFAAPKPADFHSLIIAKANRLKVRIIICDDSIDINANEKQPLSISKFEIR